MLIIATLIGIGLMAIITFELFALKWLVNYSIKKFRDLLK